MLTLGLCGGINLVHETSLSLPLAFMHDGAAVLLEDGKVVAAIEEERLDRIKHSNKFPVQSIRFCLDRRGVRLSDIDQIAYYATEEYCDGLLSRLYMTMPAMRQQLTARTLLTSLLSRELRQNVDPQRIHFVRHHVAHAMSALTMSGFDEALVLAIDGSGDHLSGFVGSGRGTSLTELAVFPQSKSLGVFYLQVIGCLGYGRFDEYKVMGLAPYGNPATYRSLMKSLYRLLPNGNYELYFDRVAMLFGQVELRKKGMPFTQGHKDLAAALQEALEEIVLHILTHHREASGHRNLCIAGGVAHNCTMNGRVLYSGLFDRVFVQPAAHDAGTALGSALFAFHAAVPETRPEPIQDVYWGTDIGSQADIAKELARWQDLITVERPEDVTRAAAALLAEGAVIGWAQGRSEFGPRALGNRSILADPRPASNKDVINQMVKKREGYRPFAPAVLEEDARDFFELPATIDQLPFMIFVVKVRKDKQSLLGATTHVDGTARLQTVSRETNPRFWALLGAFKELTGVPVLLNTSFNNNVEPIIDSARDAVVSFLTTELHYLAVGDYLVAKKPWTWETLLPFHLSFPRYATLVETRGFVTTAEISSRWEIRTTYDNSFSQRISEPVYKILMHADGSRSISALLALVAGSQSVDARSIVQELVELWSQRLVTLEPQ